MYNKLFFGFNFKYYLLYKNLELFNAQNIEEILYELQEHAYIPIVEMTEDRKGFRVLEENCKKFDIDMSELVDNLFGLFSRKEK